MNTNDVKSTLGRLGIKPNKLKGQNFLIDDSVLEKIITAAEISENEKVVEIGPGLGALTSRLLTAGADIVAIEQERAFVEYLRDHFSGQNLDVICDNAVLKIPDLRLPENYKVVANLPYAITSPVINSFLTKMPNVPELMVLLIQLEVAERLMAPPGSADRGILTVVVEAIGQMSLVTKVPNTAFSPPPKVESAVIRFDAKPSAERIDVTTLMPLVKAGFSKKRAKVINSLTMALRLPKDVIASACKKAGIDVNHRAEDLTIDNWTQLQQELSAHVTAK